MMGIGGFGVVGGFGIGLGLLVMIALVVLVVWGVSALAAPRGAAGEVEPPPRELVRRRYARGEIDRDEYEQALRALDGTGTPATGR